MRCDRSLDEIFTYAPKAKSAIDEIARDLSRYPSAYHAYAACKSAIDGLVGWGAQGEALGDRRAYDLVLGYIVDQLGL